MTRLSPSIMPDYAEVAGCSTSFKNPNSPTYESYGAYASTTLVGRQYPKNSYSAPNSVHYNNFINNANGGSGIIGNGNNHHLQYNNNGSIIPISNNQYQMNITENKMEQLMNNLNSSNTPSTPQHRNIQKMSNGLGSKSVPQTPLLSTMRRNRMNGSINGKSSNKLSSYEDARGSDQALFMKSKFDGSWQSIPSSSALTTSTTTTSNNNSPNHLQFHPSPRHHPMQSSLNQLGDSNNQTKTNSHSYLSSFGRSDKV
jgi:hypothetical protein